jgi:hypothetical protein
MVRKPIHHNFIMAYCCCCYTNALLRAISEDLICSLRSFHRLVSCKEKDIDQEMCWTLYPHCKGFSQHLAYEKAKVVSKESSDELYNSDLRHTPKEPGEVIAQGWVRYLVLYQTEPCNLAERLKNKLGYQDLISALQCIEVLISEFSTAKEVRWLPREG